MLGSPLLDEALGNYSGAEAVRDALTEGRRLDKMRVATDVAHAMQHVHEYAGMCHRDIKAANVYAAPGLQSLTG